MISCTRHHFICVLFGCTVLLSGCGEAEPETAQSSRPTAPIATPSDVRTRTPESVRRDLNCFQAEFRMQGLQIVECSLFQTGQKDISALQGLPLKALDLGMTKVEDLSPLTGMQLERLDLEATPVSNIDALQGFPLQVLKMQQTKVTDFQVLSGMPLQQLNLLDLPFGNEDVQYIEKAPLETLWLAGTQVTELGRIPLDDLESLDIERTAVAHLDVLATSPRLVRLNIAETKITDLTPLRGLRLQRITLTPQNITAGMEYLRRMDSLQEIRTNMSESQSAADFWKRYDLDLFKPIPEDSETVSEDAPPAADSDAEKESESPADNTADPAEDNSADVPAEPNAE